MADGRDTSIVSERNNLDMVLSIGQGAAHDTLQRDGRSVRQVETHRLLSLRDKAAALASPPDQQKHHGCEHDLSRDIGPVGGSSKVGVALKQRDESKQRIGERRAGAVLEARK